MRKLKKLLLIAILFSATTQAQNIAYWNFNSNPADGSTSTGTLLPAEGSGTITNVGGTSQTFATGNTSIDPAGSTDNSGMNTNTYPSASSNNKTAGIQFAVDLTNKTNIGVEFYQRLSNTAANTWVFQYTLDITAGVPVWVDFKTFDPITVGDQWHFRQVDLSAVTDLNNNPTAGFRVVSDFDPTLITSYKAANSTSTYSTSGTSRFDLIKVVSITNYTVAFAKNEQGVNESSASAKINLVITAKGNFTSSVDIEIVGLSNATNNIDYNISSLKANINSFKNVSDTIPVNVSIIDDVTKESDEYIIAKFTNPAYVTYSSSARHFLYIKDNDKIIPTASNQLSLNLLSSYSNGGGSAEISAYDKNSKRIFIANSINNQLDIVNFSDPENPTTINQISLSSYGSINSVAVNNGIVALAIESSPNKQLNGKVVFMDINGVFINQVTVGFMPDMITFNHAGNKVYTANEGEPDTSYTFDPVGSVSVIDISAGVQNINQSNVKEISFAKYVGNEIALRAMGIRIFGLGANAAQDFEPEYITISDNDSIAWVSLQENNAMAKISLTGDSIISLSPLGYKDLSNVNNSLDASNQTSGVYSSNFPIKGMYMPDAIAQYSLNNNFYILSANEGDSRVYQGASTTYFSEEARISSGSVVLDATAFPYSTELKSNYLTGRLNITTKTGDTDLDGDLDEIYSYGTRSFSIWDGQTGSQIYDSGNEFELIMENDPNTASYFNASHGTTTIKKDRSDDKGPEPEGITTANINGIQYAFISFERSGGIIAYDITNPAQPKYVNFANNRPTDRGAEGLIYIKAEDSPNGKDLLILSNEVSSTLSIYGITPCVNAGIATSSYLNSLIACEGDSVKLYANNPNSTFGYQWLQNNQPIANETDSVIYIQNSGEFRLKVYDTNGCVDTSSVFSVIFNQHSDTTLTLSTCNSSFNSPSGLYTWTNNGTYNDTLNNANGCDSVITVNLSFLTASTFTDIQTACGEYAWIDGNTYTANNNTTTYTITGGASNGCDSIITLDLTILNPATSTDVQIACGELTWIDGNTYTSNNNTATYTITGGAANSCDSIITLDLTILNIATSIDMQTACGEYTWIDGNTYITNNNTATYTIIGGAANGCDSIVTLDLTILNIATSIDMQTACGEYTWIDGNTYTSNNNTATYTITGGAANSCDSIITLDLTILNPAASTEVQIACGELTWIDGNTYTSNNNTATYYITGGAANGCDSIITLDLTILNIATSIDMHTACGDYTWIDGNTYTANNNTATYTITGGAANGCDSIVTLDLTLNQIPSVSFNIATDTICKDAVNYLVLTASPSGGIFSGANVSNDTLYIENASSAGFSNVTYSYTDNNQCTNSSVDSVFIDVCTGIKNNVNSSVVIAPNPTKGLITITTNISEIMNLEVFSSNGQLISKENFTGTKIINLEELPVGIYTVKVSNNSKYFINKIIKQ